jgi:hypothetical protein
MWMIKDPDRGYCYEDFRFVGVQKPLSRMGLALARDGLSGNRDAIVQGFRFGEEVFLPMFRFRSSVVAIHLLVHRTQEASTPPRAMQAMSNSSASIPK